MRLRWPWRRNHDVENNGQVAAEAKRAAEAAKIRQRERWPEVLRTRDELARWAEQAMRGQQ